MKITIKNKEIEYNFEGSWFIEKDDIDLDLNEEEKEDIINHHLMLVKYDIDDISTLLHLMSKWIEQDKDYHDRSFFLYSTFFNILRLERMNLILFDFSTLKELVLKASRCESHEETVHNLEEIGESLKRAFAPTKLLLLR